MALKGLSPVRVCENESTNWNIRCATSATHEEKMEHCSGKNALQCLPFTSVTVCQGSMTENKAVSVNRFVY